MSKMSKDQGVENVKNSHSLITKKAANELCPACDPYNIVVSIPGRECLHVFNENVTCQTALLPAYPSHNAQTRMQLYMY